MVVSQFFLFTFNQQQRSSIGRLGSVLSINNDRDDRLWAERRRSAGDENPFEQFLAEDLDSFGRVAASPFWPYGGRCNGGRSLARRARGTGGPSRDSVHSTDPFLTSYASRNLRKNRPQKT